MPIIHHNDLPLGKSKIYDHSKIQGRKIVTEETGAKTSEVWEQFQGPGGVINHHHEVEETITLIRGRIEVTMEGETQIVDAPATLFIPPKTVHCIRNVGDEDMHILAFFPTLKPAVVYQNKF